MYTNCLREAKPIEEPQPWWDSSCLSFLIWEGLVQIDEWIWNSKLLINWSNVLILVRRSSGKHKMLARKEKSSPVWCMVGGIPAVGGSTVLDYRQNRTWLWGSAVRGRCHSEAYVSIPWEQVISVGEENYLNPTQSHSLAGISEEAEKGKQRPTMLRLVYCSLLIRT